VPADGTLKGRRPPTTAASRRRSALNAPARRRPATFPAVVATGAGQRGRAPARRRPPTPRPGWARAALLVVLTGLVWTIASGISVENAAELHAPGGPVMFAGSMTGLVGSYLTLVMVLLVSRIPVIERVLGQDGLLRWHRALGPWPLSLIGLHAVLTTFGYAEAAKTGFWHQMGSFLSGYPDMLAAIVAFGLMALAGATSVRAVRRRLRRETWWIVHLYLYLALALAVGHVLALGPSFVGHPLTRAVWVAAWLATAGVVVAYRFGLPLVRSIRHRLVVEEVREEAPGVFSVICAGRHLERLPVAGGQFVQWRFLTRHLWWQAHPYSLSALPQPPYLRLTVKVVGDHSAALSHLVPGTRVLIEGPYGAFTRDAQRGRRVALFAGGIGVTALRALLEDLVPSSAPIVVVRVSRAEDFALRSEVASLVEARGGTLHVVEGGRRRVRFDQQAVAHLVPDLATRDVYVCGPEHFTHHVASLARRLGVHRRRLHYEVFAL